MKLTIILFFAAAAPQHLNVDMGELSFDECQQSRWAVVDTLFEHYTPTPMSINAQCVAPPLPPLPTPRPEGNK